MTAVPPVNYWRTDLAPDTADRVRQAIDDRCISQGRITKQYEERLAGMLDVPHVVATTSGTTAITMGLLAMGVRPGDEVIVPNRTFIATAHAALTIGAKVRLVDCLPSSPLIDPAKIETAITPKTKGIIPVHLNGRVADVAAVQKIADRHGLWVFEDSCQAFLSRASGAYGRRYAGTLTRLGCYSTGMTKLLATGQGGFIATRDAGLAERLRLLRSHGVVDVFDTDFPRFGANFRFNDILASIGLAQLDVMDQKMGRVLELYEFYRQGLDGMTQVRMLEVNTAGGEFPPWVEVVSPSRDRLVEFLKQRDIVCRPFLPSLHLSPHLEAAGEFPHSMRFQQEGVMLPGGPDQGLENAKRVIEAIREYERQNA